MAVTQYIGSRYVPLFAQPLDWTINTAYEPLTIVYHQGNSYTSRQAVPTGIDITDTNFWVLTGNYNAQIEQYRAEVRQSAARINENTTDIATNTQAIATLTPEVALNTTDIIKVDNAPRHTQEVVNAIFVEVPNARTQSMCAADINGARHMWVSNFIAENNIEIIHYVGETKTTASIADAGHANALAYFDGKVYIATAGGLSDTSNRGIVVIDAITLNKLDKININSVSLDYYDNAFYSINVGGGNSVIKYDTEFNQISTCVLQTQSLGIGQNTMVCSDGYYVLQNTAEPYHTVSLISVFNFDGTPKKVISFATQGEVEQVCKYNDTFLACQNGFNVVTIGEVTLSQYSTLGSLVSNLYYYRNISPGLPYNIDCYIDPAYTSDFSDGSREKPFKKLWTINAFMGYTNSITLQILNDCTDDYSFYGPSSIIRITGASQSTLLPRVNCIGEVSYNTGTYNGPAFSAVQCSVEFHNCVLKPKNALYNQSSAYITSIISCVLDFSSNNWLVTTGSTSRNIVVRDLTYRGDGITLLDINKDIGSKSGVFAEDPESCVIFQQVVMSGDINAKSRGLQDKIFSDGLEINGLIAGIPTGADVYHNLGHTSPNTVNQMRITNEDGSVYYRRVTGVQYVIIDANGNYNYPNINIGPWKKVTTEVSA